MAFPSRSDGATESLPQSLEEAGESVGDIPEQLGRRHHGDHVCLLYQTLEEKLDALAPFIQAGLERKERCAYVADPRSSHAVATGLAQRGVDVRAAIADKALLFFSNRDRFMRKGISDPALIVSNLQRMMEVAQEDGFAGLRVTGEMEWALGSQVRAEAIVELEARLNSFFPSASALGLCQYDRARFGSAVIREVLRTHPQAVVGGEVYENLFYESPEMLLGNDSADRRVEWMLAQLRRMRRAERKLVNLSGRLAEHAVENARLFAEADEAIRLRDEFLVVAAHELKTPLTALQLQLGALGRAQGDLRKLEVANRQTRRLGALVENLLDVSRISEGRLKLEPEDVLLHEAVKDVLERCHEEALRVGSEVTLNIQAQPDGCWDRLRIEQVISNLLSNAFKYGRGQPIAVTVAREGNNALLVVEDHGIGVSPDKLETIFGRFERGVPVKAYGGLGLGLYIARQIVEAHCGKVSVQSVLGEGATFRVELPARSYADAPYDGESVH
jgi:signal transduction histidine kinase